MPYYAQALNGCFGTFMAVKPSIPEQSWLKLRNAFDAVGTYEEAAKIDDLLRSR